MTESERELYVATLGAGVAVGLGTFESFARAHDAVEMLRDGENQIELCAPRLSSQKEEVMDRMRAFRGDYDA